MISPPPNSWFKTLLVSATAATVTSLGVLGLTNPKGSDYESFAVDAIAEHLTSQACSPNGSTPALFKLSLQGQSCQSLIKAVFTMGKPQLKTLVNQHTDSQDFLFFSTYRTTLNLPNPLRKYEVKVVGILDRYFVYQVD